MNCHAAGVTFHTMPAMSEIISGRRLTRRSAMSLSMTCWAGRL
jgi:hypothetical protein